MTLARLAGLALSLSLVTWVVIGARHGVHLDRDNIELAALSLVPAALSWVLLGVAWSSLVMSPSPARTVGTWARTQALRYLPGALWGSAARATTVPGATYAKVVTVLAEMGLTIAVGAAAAGVALAVSSSPMWLLLTLAVPAAVLAVAALGAGPSLWPAVARALICYGASWALYGLSAYLVQAAVGPTPEPLAIIGAACLARVAGMAALFSPSGIGVREAVFVALASVALPRGSAAAGAVASRLTLTLAELLVLVVVSVPLLRRSRPEPSPPPLPANDEPFTEVVEVVAS